jgi:hypothetical protein
MVGGMTATALKAEFGKIIEQQKILIGVMEERENASKALVAAEKAEQESLKKSSNLFTKFANVMSESTGKWGLMHRAGYAFLPFYFKLKNKTEMASRAMGKFWDIATGKTGEAPSKFGKVMNVMTSQFEKAQDIIDDKSIFGNLFGDADSRLKKLGDFFGGKQVSKAAKWVGGIKNITKDDVKAKLAETHHKLSVKANNFNIKMAKLRKAFLVNGLATFLVIGKGMLMITLAVVALWMLWRASGLNWKKIKTIGEAMWESVKFFAGIIWNGLQNIWEGIKLVYKAFGKGGELTDLLLGLWKIFGGLFEIMFGILGAIVVTALVALGGLLSLLLKWIFNKLEKVAKATDLLFTVVGILTIFVGLFLAMFTTITALPIIIVGAIILGIGLLFKQLFGGGIFGKASGGVTNGNVNLVGERGPELVKLPAGSRVYSNSQSKKMVSSGGGNNITVNVQGRIGASDSELRQIAEKVGRIINKEINRTTSSGTTR